MLVITAPLAITASQITLCFCCRRRGAPPPLPPPPHSLAASHASRPHASAAAVSLICCAAFAGRSACPNSLLISPPDLLPAPPPAAVCTRLLAVCAIRREVAAGTPGCRGVASPAAAAGAVAGGPAGRRASPAWPAPTPPAPAPTRRLATEARRMRAACRRQSYGPSLSSTLPASAASADPGGFSCPPACASPVCPPSAVPPSAAAATAAVSRALAGSSCPAKATTAGVARPPRFHVLPPAATEGGRELAGPTSAAFVRMRLSSSCTMGLSWAVAGAVDVVGDAAASACTSPAAAGAAASSSSSSASTAMSGPMPPRGVGPAGRPGQEGWEMGRHRQISKGNSLLWPAACTCMPPCHHHPACLR